MQWGDVRAGSGIPFAKVLLATAVLALPFFTGSVLACAEQRQPRVLLIGIDGASPRLTEPLLAAGRLPNLARIAESGASGLIDSEKPLVSPRIWNTISTGKTPDKHGIFSFTRKGDDGADQLLLSTDRKVHALWNIASDAGLRVAIVNWWNTFPPERVRGVMVSDHLIAKVIESRMNFSDAEIPAGITTHPEDREDHLIGVARDGPPPVSFANPFAGDSLIGPLPSWALPAVLTKWFDQDAALVRIALEVEAVEKPDLMMVLLPGIDRVSHSLWGTLEPQSLYPERLHASDAERAAGANALRNYYVYTDALIGRLIERFDRNDLVIVVSDHGFEAGVKFERLTGTHDGDAALEGVVFARGAGIEPGSRVDAFGIADVTPTILAWLGPGR